jgi:hypothetical protein
MAGAEAEAEAGAAEGGGPLLAAGDEEEQAATTRAAVPKETIPMRRRNLTTDTIPPRNTAIIREYASQKNASASHLPMAPLRGRDATKLGFT